MVCVAKKKEGLAVNQAIKALKANDSLLRVGGTHGPWEVPHA